MYVCICNQIYVKKKKKCKGRTKNFRLRIKKKHPLKFTYIPEEGLHKKLTCRDLLVDG